MFVRSFFSALFFSLRTTGSSTCVRIFYSKYTTSPRRLDSHFPRARGWPEDVVLSFLCCYFIPLTRRFGLKPTDPFYIFCLIFFPSAHSHQQPRPFPSILLPFFPDSLLPLNTPPRKMRGYHARPMSPALGAVPVRPSARLMFPTLHNPGSWVRGSKRRAYPAKGIVCLLGPSRIEKHRSEKGFFELRRGECVVIGSPESWLQRKFAPRVPPQTHFHQLIAPSFETLAFARRGTQT